MKLLLISALLLLNGWNSFSKVYAAKYSVEAYFNNSQSYSYTDPYRNISRKGQNLEKVVIDSIRSAKKSIVVAVQELRLPFIAAELIKKHQEGVDVRIVLENNYNTTVLSPFSFIKKNAQTDEQKDELDESDHDSARYDELKALVDLNRDGIISESELMSRDAVYMLRANSIKIKDDTSNGSAGSGLMHHKFIVVDDKELIVSSANFTMSGIHGDLLNKRSRGNANSMLKISSPSLASHFKDEFNLLWGGEFGRETSRFGLAKPYRDLFETSVRNSKVSAQFSPTARGLGFKKSVNGTISDVLDNAKKEILISLFVFSDQNIANTLKKKKQQNKNIDINVLVERKFATRFYSELLDLWGIQMRGDNCSFEYKNNPWESSIKSAGVPNLESGDLLHHKFAVVDNETVIVGSQNWSDSANHLNDENIIIIKDSHLASLYAKEFHRLNRFAQLGPSRSLIEKIEVLDQKCSSSY